MGMQATPPSTANYVVGKGVLSVGTWAGTTPPAGYSAMGNCPSIEVEPKLERLPHYSSQASFRLKDKNPVIQTDYTVSFTCDEIAAVNLNKFLVGTISGNVIAALQAPDTEFALKFVSDNPVGPNQTWEFWRGTLMPNGALQLIGEEWMVMDFIFEGLADSANHAAVPYFQVSYSSSSSSSSSLSSSSSSSSSSGA